MTELMSQLWSGSKDKVMLLLQKGSSINAVDLQGLSALDYAISRGHLDVAKKLLEEHPELLKSRVFEGRRRPCYSLILACQVGNLELVELMVSSEEGKALINASENQFKPIYFACEIGNHHIVKLLLDAGGAAQALEKMNCGSFPLGIACMKGHLAVVQTLLEACGPPILRLVDSEGFNALHIASQSGHAEIAKLLISAGGADLVSSADRDGLTCLDLAAEKGYCAVARVILAAPGGAALLHRTYDGPSKAGGGHGGFTCLFGAAQNGHAEMVVLLLEAAGDRAGELARRATSIGANPLYVASQVRARCVGNLRFLGFGPIWLRGSGRMWGKSSRTCAVPVAC
jgi:ankyrin repeat protein